MTTLGLLLDVDGPLASPRTRTIAIPSILDDLVALVGAGVPIAFITGRSDAFIREQVVAPLLERGLGDALAGPGARMEGVFEKGASWAGIGSDGMGEVSVDRRVALPEPYVAAVRDLVEREFAGDVFFDETKRAMVSVEQRTEVSPERYREVQTRFDEAAFALAAQHGLGIRFGDREQADAEGRVPFRIDPTIISTDIESVTLDKDTGARRALERFRATGDLPRTWFTMGDSRSDYKMSDALHEDGYDVTHVDVRPSDGVLTKPYPVIADSTLIHDEAGAAQLAGWRAALGV